MTPIIKLLMIVLTVRSVATFLRAPWCNSMVMTFFDGWEKQTERWDISLTSWPASVRHSVSIYHSSFHGIPRGPSTLTILDLMCTLTVPLLALFLSRSRDHIEARCPFPRRSLIGSLFCAKMIMERSLTIRRYGQRLLRVYVPHLDWWVNGGRKSSKSEIAAEFREIVGLLA